jgi:heat shock protein HslJ
MMKNILFIFFATIVGTGCSHKLSPDHYWIDHRWVVKVMKQVPVQLSGTNRDAYLEFSANEKRFTGNGGCNRLSGNYMPDKKSSIHFSQVISTKMSCADIAFETTFLALLNKTNRYEIIGNNMLLKDRNEVLLILERR